MSPYGKTAQTAIAAMSRLAEVYDAEKRTKLNSADIAAARKLPKPVVAKVLTILSQAGFVAGSPGPGGGYWLAKPPGEISLLDIVSLFDRIGDNLSCPFGPEWCGNGPRCPMHHALETLRGQVAEFLRSNTFAPFVGWKPDCPAPTPTVPLNILPPKPRKPPSPDESV